MYVFSFADGWNTSFRCVQTSTQLTSFALNLSIHENSIQDAPLNLVVNKPATTDTGGTRSPIVPDLRNKNSVVKQPSLEIESNHTLNDINGLPNKKNQTSQNQSCVPCGDGAGPLVTLSFYT